VAGATLRVVAATMTTAAAMRKRSANPCVKRCQVPARQSHPVNVITRPNGDKTNRSAIFFCA
jgi:hypothetical protein